MIADGQYRPRSRAFAHHAFARTAPMGAVMALGIATVCAGLLAGAARADPLGNDLGGVASRSAAGDDAFRLPPASLNRRQLERFFAGQRLFNLAWVKAPSPLVDTDGLGPTFNRVSCGRCHVNNGRGRPPATPGAPLMSMLLRLAVPGADRHGGPKPHPVYGDQLQDRAIPGVPPEGRARIEWREIEGRYADGTPYRLRAPIVTLERLAFGPAGDQLRLSARIAPPLIGLGLLVAVPEKSILAHADPDDRDRDGVSGRANRVWDRAAGRLALGRFGWKAGQPSLRQQTARALSADMGLTTSLFPDETCPPGQSACRSAPDGGTPEVSDDQLAQLAFYAGLLVVPRRRNAETPEVRRGETLFRGIGCAACHRMTMRTGGHPVAALAGQTIHPFTDLLLHDMGPGLADELTEFAARGAEWRTPPLWGIGLTGRVNGHRAYLHDGRARSLAEAILWHGGEGAAAKDAFRHLPKADRDALIAFLNSL